MKPYYIGPEGPRESPLAIVAEKPGKNELKALLATNVGRPLIGYSGEEVNRHLLAIGSSRSEVYLTNSVKHFDAVYDNRKRDWIISTPTFAEIVEEQPSLYKELASMPNLNCIIALGNVAMQSLSNFRYGDISRRRGSILPTCLGVKMVPTYHPAFYMRGEWRFSPIVQFDMKRALEQSQFPELRYLERTYYIGPTFDEAVEWLLSLMGAAKISFDIECVAPSRIACVGFSDERDRAYCIPLIHKNRKPYFTLTQEVAIWRLIDLVLNQPNTCYITQNGMFDCWHLWRHGVRTSFMGKGFDTMYSHRLVMPDMPHRLDFITSIYTEEPYYKDESGRWTGDINVDERQFWIYNCKDACTTLESQEALTEDMAELNMLDYYNATMQPQFDPLMDMRKWGMRIDTERLNRVRDQLRKEVAEIQASLNTTLGYIPNTKSWKDMGRLLGDLGIIPDLTPTGRPKTDKERMYTYAQRTNSDAARFTLMQCLSITEKRTILSNFLGMALDNEGFYHPSLDLSKAVSGRSASEGADEGGPQIQNIPQRMRSMFIPDDYESVIVQADQRQAEAMYVAWDAQDMIAIEAFLRGKDSHRVFGCVLYRGWTSNLELPPDELLASIKEVCDTCADIGEKKCNHSERYMSKMGGHGFRYLMSVLRFQMEQAKKNIFVAKAEAERIRTLAINPSVARWHERVADQLRRTRWLENPLGRRREFYGLFDNEMIRKGLSWLAQSTVSELTNRAMVELHNTLPKDYRIIQNLKYPYARLYTQTHDSLTFCARKDLVKDLVPLINKAFDIPIHLHGRVLRIPIEITVGPSWGEQSELARGLS